MSDKVNVHHWHVAHGLAGYGSEGIDGLACYTDPESLADGICDELGRDVNAVLDSAHAAAESEDFESAWKLWTLAHEIEILGRQLNNDRRNAPAYEHDRDAWHATILRIVAETFPMVIDPPAQQLYVWECSEGYNCEHYHPTAEERIARVLAIIDAEGPSLDMIHGQAIRTILTERTPE